MDEPCPAGRGEEYGACEDEAIIEKLRILDWSVIKQIPPWENPPVAPSQMGRRGKRRRFKAAGGEF